MHRLTPPIAHGAIKPENILVDTDCRHAKISDAGSLLEKTKQEGERERERERGRENRERERKKNKTQVG